MVRRCSSLVGTFFFLAVVELVRRFIAPVPDPGVFFLVAVVYASCIGGIACGLLSSLFVTLYAAYFFSSGPLFHYTPESLFKVATLAVVSSGISLMVGFLWRHTMRQLGQLRQTENQLQQILDNSTAVIYLKDLTGRYLLINHRFELLFHVPKESVRGKTDYDFFPREMADAFQENDRKVLKANAPLEFDEVAPQPDGPHAYISIKFPLNDSKGVPYGVCGISTDVTDRKKAEEEVRKAKDDLETRVKKRTGELLRVNEELKRQNEVRSSFTSIVSHELRTPLSAIKTGVDMTVQGVEGPIPSRVAETLQIVQNSVDRLARLVDNVLDYTRLEAGKLELTFKKTNVSRLVEEVYGLMKIPLGKKEIHFSCKIPPIPVETVCDDDKVKQVLINLVDNAMKFTERGGAIILRLFPPSDGLVQIEVSDTGIGIAAGEQKTIFELFSQITQRGTWKAGGSGIGLAVCKLLVDLHQGKISVKSEPGKGSQFTVSFPSDLPESL